VAAYSAGLEFKRAGHVRQLKPRLSQAPSDLQAARVAESAASSALVAAKKRLDRCDLLAQRYEREFLAARMADIGERLASIKTNTAVTKMIEWAEGIRVSSALALAELPQPKTLVHSVHVAHEPPMSAAPHGTEQAAAA
jgi:hypothetical protein